MINLQTGAAEPAIDRAPVLTSAGAPWEGVSLEQHASGPAEVANAAAPAHVIVLQLKQTAVLECGNSADRTQAVHLRPGLMAIVPAMAPHTVRTFDTGEFVSVRLDPKFVLCAAHELISPAGLELSLEFGVDDPFLRAGILALKTETETGHCGGRIYGETLGSALAVHLVRHYAVRSSEPPQRKGGLGRPQLRRVIEFIHEHLADDISLSSLAAVAGLSPYHFARLFKQATGLTPHQFVVRCRVERARQLLMVARASVADVALSVGFYDQSHLAAHFKRTYGVTPKTFCQEMARAGSTNFL